LDYVGEVIAFVGKGRVKVWRGGVGVDGGFQKEMSSKSTIHPSMGIMRRTVVLILLLISFRLPGRACLCTVHAAPYKCTQEFSLCAMHLQCLTSKLAVWVL
jgi:hypothetical protein